MINLNHNDDYGGENKAVVAQGVPKFLFPTGIIPEQTQSNVKQPIQICQTTPTFHFKSRS